MLDNISTVYSIRKKTGTIYSDPIAIGSKPQFISPLRNSNNHNLEEQLVLGTDSVQETWSEEGCDRIRISYYDFDNKPSAYYYIDTYIYNDTTPAGNKYAMRDGRFFLTSFDEYEADDNQVFLQSENAQFSIVGGKVKIENYSAEEDKGFIIRRDYLRVHREGQADVNVSLKTTYVTNPINGVSKTIEVIESI